MKIRNLVEIIKAKAKITTDQDLCRYLGVTQPALISWKNKNKTVDEKLIAQLIRKSRQSATEASHIDTITPIVEFFPVTPVPTIHNKKYQIFKSDNSATRYKKELKDRLASSHGIYVFHDSRGRALYAGKARKTKLWNEINNALNRPRYTQTVYRVKHPDQDKQFKDANEKNRQPRLRTLYLYELAKYFSAYEIVDGMIDRLEALLVRCFANDLLNRKMEKFARKRKKKVKSK